MSNEIDKERIARDAILGESEEIQGRVIEGYDFDKGVDYSEILKSFESTGFMASHFSKAIGLINKMIEEEAQIYLGYTSNMVSSGLRDIFRFLVKHKKVDVVVTTAGGVEEDIIKCIGNFILGDFKADGKELREKGINRIGNIFVPNSRYIAFEKFVTPILEESYQKQKETGEVISSSEFVWKLGEKINDERSICYWAWKNKIRIYCPAITDGSFGDMVYFFTYKRPDFKIDIASDIRRINDSTIGLNKSGVILLGSGVIKHHILNAHLYRNGADYSVYINNAQEFDGSDAGALPEEAISWGKVRKDSDYVKVFGDATILFPLIVAETFSK